MTWRLRVMLFKARLNRKINRNYWAIFIALTIIIVAVRLMTGLDYKLYGHFIVTGISAGMISLIATPYLLIRQKKGLLLTPAPGVAQYFKQRNLCHQMEQYYHVPQHG